ncbi:MAG: Rpn family recombination-promoting nuclease/putative transposase, partial [Gammaproteobacteria bacterium]
MIDQDNNADIKTETVIDDYDSPWKDIVEHYLPEFMAFYFPAAFAEIDWSEEPVFLDQELRAVVRDAELGKRFVDKLVRVVLLNGDEKWIYLHIEVQGSRQTEFAERMFVYNYRIYDRYRRPIASMAVLADEHINWRPDYFSYRALGSETSIRFPIAKLTDYHDQLDELQTSENSFAIVTATHILTQRTRKNDYERYQAKRLLVRLLYQRMWDKQRVIDLFYMIDWMMRLPEELEQQLWLEIETIEESKKMQYVTSVERIGIAKGRQEGRQEGLQEGREEAEIEMLSIMLRHRFGDLPDTTQSKLKQASEDQLKKWLINA